MTPVLAAVVSTSLSKLLTSFFLKPSVNFNSLASAIVKLPFLFLNVVKVFIFSSNSAVVLKFKPWSIGVSIAICFNLIKLFSSPFCIAISTAELYSFSSG